MENSESSNAELEQRLRKLHEQVDALEQSAANVAAVVDLGARVEKHAEKIRWLAQELYDLKGPGPQPPSDLRKFKIAATIFGEVVAENSSEACRMVSNDLDECLPEPYRMERCTTLEPGGARRCR